MPRNTTDALAALLFLAAALWFGGQALMLDLGTARNMGPGMFPLLLSGALLVLALIVGAGAFMGPADDVGTFALRGMLFILPAPIAFALTVRGLGFVPAVFLATLIASRASAQMRWGTALAIALGVTLFATLVFSYALGLPFRRFGPWLAG